MLCVVSSGQYRAISSLAIVDAAFGESSLTSPSVPEKLHPTQVLPLLPPQRAARAPAQVLCRGANASSWRCRDLN